MVVCAKNSAPLSPVVSKSSSGAMELMNVFSVNNLMNFLDGAQSKGWQVIGASLGEDAVNLADVNFLAPTILVLGNEGHGIRTNIKRRCSSLVQIAPQTHSIGPHIESLNVSVTGGIILHYMMNTKK